MSKLKSLLTGSAIYSISILASKSGHYFLLPIIWHEFSIVEFGILGLCQAIGATVSPLFEWGQSNALHRYYLDWGSNDRGKYVFGTSAIALLLALSVLTTLLLAGAPFFSHLVSQVSYWPNIPLAIVSSFFLSLTSFPNVLLRIENRLKYFTWASIAHLILQCGFVYYFTIEQKGSIPGYLLGLLLANLCYLIILFPAWVSKMTIGFNKKYFTATIRYSIPLVPSSLIEIGNEMAIRFVMDKYASLTAIGIFNIARQFGGLLNIANNALKSAFVPMVYRLVSTESDSNARSELGNLSRHYVIILCFCSIATALFTPDLITLMGDDNKSHIVYFIPFFIIGYLIQGSSTALGRGCDLAKKTKYLNIVTFSSLIVSIGAGIFLIPKFDLVGAIYAFLIAQTFKATIHIIIAMTVYKRPTNWVELATLWAITISPLILSSKTWLVTAWPMRGCLLLFMSALYLSWLKWGDRFFNDNTPRQ